MKKFKKLFSFVVSMAIAASCVPMQAMAEGETATVEPEIMFYRDYEDYKGGNHQWYSDGIGDYSGNNSKFYGTWNWSIDDSAAKPSLAVDGFDGKAVKYMFSNDSLSYSTNQGSFTDISNGKIYFAFDIWGDENEPNRVMNLKLVGETDKEMYVLCMYPGVRWCKGNVSWMTGETSTDFMNGVSEKTRVELVIDPEAGTVDRYFNGNFGHQLTFTPQTITSAAMYISQGHTMDNFSVVHYPESYTDSFSITDAKVNMKDNSVSVFLNSNAYDSNGAQVKGDATFNYPIAAPYGVTLASVDASSFMVTKGDAPLTVTGVTKGEANGEYVISVSEPITAGAYTVSVADGVEDICENVANPAENSKTVSIETEPQVLVYRDFEDYQGGNGFSNTGQYGTFLFSFDKDFGWGNSTKEVGRTGVGFQSNTTNQSLYNKKLPEDVRTAGSGYVYISITSEAIEGETRSGRFALSGKDGYRYFGFTHGAAYSTSQWRNSGVTTALPTELQNLDYYKVEVIFDLETGLQYNYVNGTLINTCTRNGNADFVNGTFDFSFEDGVITDNLVMLYYPKNIVDQTFSIQADEIDIENDTIKVAFTSDAVDSNGANGAKIEAPYGVILKDEPTAEDFTIEGCTVISAEPTGVFGEYILTVAEDLQSGTVYNVSVNKALKDTFGAEFAGNTAEVQVITEAEIFYYRDFEEYIGGNPWPAETSKDYGSKSLFGDRQFDSATKIKTAGGTGVKFGAMADGGQITEGTLLGDLTDGTLYIAYNEMPGGGREDVYPNRSAGGNAGSNFWCWNGTNWASGNNNWGLGSTQGMKGVGVNHKIELVVDIAARKVYRYVDGVCVQPAGCNLAMTEYKDLTFRFTDNSALDDIAIVYFPEKLVSMPTFSVSAGNFDAEANTVSVFLKSDAVDSDANDTAYYAPYGVSLASFDASSFTVDGYTVTGVTKGEASGEYVLAIAEDFAEDAELTVTAADGLADILGSKINADVKSVVVKAAAEAEPVYTVSDITVSGSTASVTYTNTTEKAESFVLIIASYEGERLSEVNFEVVTAETDSVDVAKSVSLENSVEGKTVKAFIFDSFTSLKPIK